MIIIRIKISIDAFHHHHRHQPYHPLARVHLTNLDEDEMVVTMKTCVHVIELECSIEHNTLVALIGEGNDDGDGEVI